MAQIHPTAVVDPRAELAADVSIGPLCYVGPRVRIGAGTKLMSHVAVFGPAEIGAGNTIWTSAVLGADPQDLKFHGEETQLVVGDHNDIREFATLHRGTANGGGVTRVGSHNLLMVGAHVAHDCQLGDHIILANAVLLAGHVKIENHAVISGATALHHFVTVGQYAFVGGMTRVVNDAPPFMKLEGNPAKVRGVNTIGLQRGGFPEASAEHLKLAYRRLFRGGGDEDGSGAGTVTATLAQLEAACGDDPCIAALAQFLRNKAVGLYGRFREAARPDSRHQGATR